MRILFQAKFLVLVAWFTIANVSLANAQKTIDLEVLKEACESIGFKPKTESFGNCVLKLSDNKNLKLIRINNTPNKNKTNEYDESVYANLSQEEVVELNYQKLVKEWKSHNASCTKKADIPNHCSEKYGCPDDPSIKPCMSFDKYKIVKPNKSNSNLMFYGTEIKKENYHGYFHECPDLKKQEGWCYHYSCEKKTYLADSINTYKQQCFSIPTNRQDTKYARMPIENANSVENSSFLEDLLSIGIVIGGAYLLGTALTPAPPPPAATTNIFTTIIQETPKQGIIGY